MQILRIAISFICLSSFAYGMDFENLLKRIPSIPTNGFIDALEHSPHLLEKVHENGRTLLIQAVINRRSDLVKIMLLKPNIYEILNTREKFSGRSALHYAVSLKQVTITSLLLGALGIEVNLPTEDRAQNTPLHLAGNVGSRECYELLIKHNADPEKLNALRPPKPPTVPTAGD